MFKPALDEHEIEIPGEQILDQIRQAAAGSRNGPSIIKLLDRLFAAP
jgi:glutamyl-tRNA reductase